MENDYLVRLITRLDSSKTADDLKKIEQQLSSRGIKIKTILDTAVSKQEIETLAVQLQSILKNHGLDIDTSKILSSINKIRAEINSVTTKANKIQLLIDNRTYEAQIASIQSKLQKWGFSADEVQTKLSKLNVAYNNMVNANTQDGRIQKEKLYQQELEKTKNSLTILSSQIASISEKKALSNKIQTFLTKNTGISQGSKDELQSYIALLDKSDDIAVPALNNIKNAINRIENAERQAGNLGKSFTDTIKAGVKKFVEWGVASNLVMSAWRNAKKMVDAVYDIDTSMTSLYKVTDETASKYNEFLTSSSAKAQELGRSVSSLVEQTANWAKLGFNLDEAKELAEISSIYANVGEVDDDTAVSDIVTAMKAFNIEASDAITIVDMLNTLGNKYATSASDLGAGLSNSASAMATAGTDIEKTLAMLTGGAEITQSADEFGNMLKVGSMRVRGMKGELETLGEEIDENVESISKMQTQILNLTHGKVNIFDDNGGFKDYYEIMEGVAKVYSELSSTDQASLLEILFGKQRGNQGAALIQAFQSGQIQKAYADIQNSSGSAYAEQERWLESLEAKTQQFEAAFQSLSKTVLDSNLLKFFVDLGTTGLNAIDGFINKFGTIGTIGLGTGLFAGIKNVG